MSSQLELVACFEAATLLQLLLPRLRRDKQATLVMSGARGRLARRILTGAVLTSAVVGGLTIALGPAEALSPWWLTIVMVSTQLPGQVFLAWQWRMVQALPEERSIRNASLDLGAERAPKLAWLALVPPFVTLGLLFWIAAHWSVMLVRDTLGYEPGATAWRDPAFRSIAQLLFFGIGWSIWSGIFGLTMWHGVSRQYSWRRAHLEAAVATAWSFTLLWPALVLPLWLRLPPLGLLLCAVAATSGASLLLMFAPRARREWESADMHPSSYRWYFDRRDPSAFGDRGMNLGSPWNWALFSAPTVFFALPTVLAFL